MKQHYARISHKTTAQITLFNSATDTRPRRTISWRSMASMKRFFEITVERPTKKELPLFSRALCVERRAKANLRGPLLVLLDIDKSSTSLEACSDQLASLRVPHVGYTTWRHAGGVLDLHSYRVVTNLVARDWESLKGITLQLCHELGQGNDFVADPASWDQIAFFVPGTDGKRKIQRVSWLTKGGSYWRPNVVTWERLLQAEAKKRRKSEKVVPPRDPSTIDVEEVRLALTAIPNDERDQWVRTGQCLEGSGLDEHVARELWDEWSNSERSEGSGKYEPLDQERVWQSFDFLRRQSRDPESHLGIESLFKDAYEAGWVAPRPPIAPAREDFAEDALEEEIASARGAAQKGVGSAPKGSETVEVDPGALQDRNKLLRDLNERYAYVALGQGRVTDVPEGDHMTRNAFLDLWNHPKFPTGLTVRGEPELKSVGEWWYHRFPKRRSYRRVDFLPPGGPDELPKTTLNLWRGWGADPREGDCSRFLDHVAEVVCGGHEDEFRWVEAWMAHLVQRPWEKPRTAIVMKSTEGTGKGIFARALVRLAGRHGIHVTDAKKLTGTFNSHLANKIVVFADEVTWGGRRQEEGVLKTMITEPTVVVEPKGVDSYEGRSFCRVLVSGNSEWLIPAGPTARRFMVTTVSESRANDDPYFQKVLDELAQGGLEALHHHLLEIDLEARGAPDPTKILNTRGLLEQKLEGLEPVVAWIVDRLQEGMITAHVPWEDKAFWVPSGELYESYMDSARCVGLKRRSTEMLVVRRLKDVFGKIQGRRQDVEGVNRKEKRLPGVEEARALVSKYLRQDMNWGE